jgi:hypothetical protein
VIPERQRTSVVRSLVCIDSHEPLECEIVGHSDPSCICEPLQPASDQADRSRGQFAVTQGSYRPVAGEEIADSGVIQFRGLISTARPERHRQKAMSATAASTSANSKSIKAVGRGGSPSESTLNAVG